ncbi:MAG: cyclic nucleotide-binding domain-containing protein [Chloroflexota bacterium]
MEKILREIPLFQLLPANAFANLVQIGKTISYPAETIVCHEGDKTDAMYVILAGQVRIYKQDKNEQEVEITTMQQGEFFGEMALLGSQLRSATVACVSDCRFFMLEKAAFLSLLSNAETQVISLSVVASLVKRMGDLTEKYVTEELAQRMLQAEMEAKRHRTMTQMVAGVAHELNTPLGVVNMAVGMIETRVQSPELTEAVAGKPKAQAILADVREASQLAQRNGQRARQLVENFKKVSVNQLTLILEEVDIRTLVAEILELCKLNTRRANLRIAYSESIPTEQAVWLGYPGHLTQVLTNLLINIERYAYPQETGGTVQISLRRTQDDFVLQVEDFGQGIAPENLPHIFEPFFTTGRVKGGTGLGLSIVHNIMTTVLQGEVQVVSEVNQGTRVILSFPQEIVTE